MFLVLDITVGFDSAVFVVSARKNTEIDITLVILSNHVLLVETQSHAIQSTCFSSDFGESRINFRVWRHDPRNGGTTFWRATSITYCQMLLLCYALETCRTWIRIFAGLHSIQLSFSSLVVVHCYWTDLIRVGVLPQHYVPLVLSSMQPELAELHLYRDFLITCFQVSLNSRTS